MKNGYRALSWASLLCGAVTLSGMTSSVQAAKTHHAARASAQASVQHDAYQRALDALRVGHVTEAHALLRERLHQMPQDMAACRLLATLLLDSGQRQEAAAVLAAGQAQAPENTDVALALARLMVDSGDTAGAFRVLDKSAEQATKNAPYLAFMAVLAQQTGQVDRSADLWQQALQLAPERGDWWLALGRVYQGRKDRTAARQAYEKAMTGSHLTSAAQREVKALLHQVSDAEAPHPSAH